MTKLYFVGNVLFSVDYISTREPSNYDVSYGNWEDVLQYQGPQHAHRLVLEEAIKRLAHEHVVPQEYAKFDYTDYQEVGSEIH